MVVVMEIDEIKVGMHVRTEHGKIWRVISTKAIDGHRRRIVNASFDVIDLIEPQDLMYIDISPDNWGGIVVPRVAESMNELNYWKKLFRSGECVLKGIVTHEQLNSDVFEINGWWLR